MQKQPNFFFLPHNYRVFTTTIGLWSIAEQLSILTLQDTFYMQTNIYEQPIGRKHFVTFFLPARPLSGIRFVINVFFQQGFKSTVFSLKKQKGREKLNSQVHNKHCIYFKITLEHMYEMLILLSSIISSEVTERA